MLLMLFAALTASAHAGEKKTLNLGLVPKSQQAAPVQVSNPPQGANPNDPNVRVYDGGGAEDLLKVTRPFDDSSGDAIQEGDQRQNIEAQRLQNQLPNGLSNAASRTSNTPLNSQGR